MKIDSCDLNSMLFALLLQTNNHNWHIHLDPVLNQAQCSIALGKSLKSRLVCLFIDI